MCTELKAPCKACPWRIKKAEADRMAGELQSGDAEWKYSTAPAPENRGIFCIEVREQDGSFVWRFWQ